MYDYELERLNTNSQHETNLQWLEDVLTFSFKSLFCGLGLLLYGMLVVFCVVMSCVFKR